jgi:PAS domain S-box-containing protein
VITKSLSFQKKHTQPLPYIPPLSSKRTAKSKKKTLELQHSEKQYRLLFEKNPFPMWIFDKSTLRFLAVNQAAIMHYGFSKKEFLDMTVFDIRPKEEIARTKAFIKKQVKSPLYTIGNAGTWLHSKKNGQRIYVESTYNEITFNSRRAVLLLANDITERKIAEEAAGELHRKIIHILDSITDGFISCDRQWRITYINKRADRLLHLNIGFIVGKRIWHELPRDLSQILQAKMRFALQQQEGMTFDAKYLDSKWLQFHIYPSMEGVSLYIHDVTAEKEISMRKDEFISIASHELRTPVTSIKAYGQLLEKRIKKIGDDRSILYIDKLTEQVGRLAQLLNDLLDVSRIQRGTLLLKKEQLDMHKVLQDVCDAIQETTQTHTITLHGTSQHLVYVDGNKIGEVITNLITNAIKYSPNAAAVDVTLEEKDMQVYVHVKDKGIGIAHDLKDKVFARFYRVSNETASTGLGLGLYISKSIIKQHGGNLWVESEPGVGSTFSFSLPIEY